MRRQLVLFVEVDDETDADRLSEIVDSFARQVTGYGLAGYEAGMACEPVEDGVEP